MQVINIVAGIFFLGGCGALLRYATLVVLVNNLYAILLLNVVASFLLGLLSASTGLSSPYKTIIIFGFLGSLSTFSSFALQMHQLFLEGQYIQASVIFISNNVLSILACYLGYKLLLNL